MNFNGVDMLAYTNAPVQYDGFGTKEICVLGFIHNKPFRLVYISPEHADWQLQRYYSGMYMVTTHDQIETIVANPEVFGFVPASNSGK